MRADGPDYLGLPCIQPPLLHDLIAPGAINSSGLCLEPATPRDNLDLSIVADSAMTFPNQVRASFLPASFALAVTLGWCGALGAAAPEGKFAEGMHLLITGSGSAMPDPERAGASAVVTVDGKILLFDCGRGVMENMIRAGINPVNVDYAFLTHHHFDHIASYDYFIYSTWIAGRQEVLPVFGPPGTVELHDSAVHGMHAADFKFVQFIVENWPPGQEVRPRMEPPFQVKDVRAGVFLKTENFTVTAVETIHYPYPDHMSLAYRVDSRHGSIVISGDTGPSEEVARLAKNADILLHEMTKPDPGMLSGGKFASKEFQDPSQKRPQTGHTAPTELGKLATGAGVKLLVGYHLNPLTGSDAMIDMMKLYTGQAAGQHIWTEFIHAVKNEFDGPFVLAEDGMVFSVGPNKEAKADAK
jgi:ribonuclease BN (tRNA processing enzyme)